MSKENRDRYVVDYQKLYVEVILDAIRSVEPDGQREFVDSSPSNGIIALEPYTKIWGIPGSANYGDMHYYDYDADCENYTSYPKARFISEHGV